jgi:hypothetical protein
VGYAEWGFMLSMAGPTVTIPGLTVTVLGYWSVTIGTLRLLRFGSESSCFGEDGGSSGEGLTKGVLKSGRLFTFQDGTISALRTRSASKAKSEHRIEVLR